MNGQSCTTLKPWLKPLLVSICRGIILPGFLRWCIKSPGLDSTGARLTLLEPSKAGLSPASGPRSGGDGDFSGTMFRKHAHVCRTTGEQTSNICDVERVVEIQLMRHWVNSLCRCLKGTPKDMACLLAGCCPQPNADTKARDTPANTTKRLFFSFSHVPNPPKHGCCWETFYIFAYCGSVGNPHLTAKK